MDKESGSVVISAVDKSGYPKVIISAMPPHSSSLSSSLSNQSAGDRLELKRAQARVRKALREREGASTLRGTESASTGDASKGERELECNRATGWPGCST